MTIDNRRYNDTVLHVYSRYVHSKTRTSVQLGILLWQSGDSYDGKGVKIGELAGRNCQSQGTMATLYIYYSISNPQLEPHFSSEPLYVRCTPPPRFQVGQESYCCLLL